jgi:hypothetical protein
MYRFFTFVIVGIAILFIVLLGVRKRWIATKLIAVVRQSTLASNSPSGVTVNSDPTDSGPVVSSTPSMTNVNRIGINLGASGQSWYGDADLMQNLFDDPGFEPGMEAHLAIVGTTHTSTTFNDTTDNGEKTGFWNGGAASVRVGVSAGRTFTIGTFVSGGNYICSPNCPTLNAGDVVALTQTGPTVVADSGNIASNWRGIGDGDEVVSTAQKYEGASSLAFNVADGRDHRVLYYFDTGVPTVGGVCSDNVTICTAAKASTDCAGIGAGTCTLGPYSGPWHPVVGPFKISFYALASGTSSGTPTVKVQLQRNNGVNVNHTFTLTNDGNWHQYVYKFIGTDTRVSAKDQMGFNMIAGNGSPETGATIYVDDAYLGKNEASTTGFRDETVNTLAALNPGSIRYMLSVALAENDAHYEGPSGCSPGATTTGGCDFLRGPAGTCTTCPSGASASWSYSSTSTYAVAKQLGALPWFSIGNVMSDADLKAFIDNACTAFNTYNFPSIWIEQSNEDWNGSAGYLKFAFANGGKTYGAVAGRNFSVMSKEAASKCPANAARIHYVVGNQLCNNGVVSGALTGASNAGYPIPNTSQYASDDATYLNGGTNVTTAGALPAYTGSLTSQAAQYATWFFESVPPNTKCVGSDRSSALGSNQAMTVYEAGPSAVVGPGSTEQMYLSQIGFTSAGYMALDWILGTQQLAPLQIDYEITQTAQGNNPSYPLWGVNHDLDADFGPTFPHLRPQALAMELVNSAIGGDYYAVTGMPTGTYANAFENGSNWSAALVNSTPSRVSLTVQFPATGTLPAIAKTVLYTNSITDNNENSSNVYIGALPGGMKVSGRSVTITLPPYAVVALNPATGGATPRKTATTSGGVTPTLTSTPTASRSEIISPSKDPS